MAANTYYKTKPSVLPIKSVGIKTKAFVRKASGVSRIVRDTYGKPSDWWTICKEVKKRDGHKCVFCKAPEDPKNKIFHDVHHVTPLSRGGTTTKANLATTCEKCHKRRHKHMHK